MGDTAPHPNPLPVKDREGEPTEQPRIAVLIPTLNEEKSIGDLIARIPRDLVSRIIVADGGSRDATIDCARSAGADVIAVGSGYGRACLAAAKAAADCDVL